MKKNAGPSWEVALLAYFAAALPFVIGTVFSPALGWYGTKLAYDVGTLLMCIAVIMTAIVYKMRTGETVVENGVVMPKMTYGLGILFILVIAMIFGTVVYVHDKYVNPPEKYCNDIGTDTRDMAGLARVIALDQGTCIQNETGFHANGKAIFP